MLAMVFGSFGGKSSLKLSFFEPQDMDRTPSEHDFLRHFGSALPFQMSLFVLVFKGSTWDPDCLAQGLNSWIFPYIDNRVHA